MKIHAEFELLAWQVSRGDEPAPAAAAATSK